MPTAPQNAQDTMTTQEPPQQQMIVLGAGPVGLASALLLAAQGHAVDVYEAKDALVLENKNSYPIGVNPRGQETLRRIDPTLLRRLRDNGEVVAAFNIFAEERRVAELPSGTLLATTRAFLTKILFEQAQQTDGVTIHFGHRLVDLNLTSRTLTFELSEQARGSGNDGNERLVLDASAARVLACDGVWSATRQALEQHVPGFRPRVGDWGLHFRVAFSQPGARAPRMTPSIHYIFTSKGIYTATLRDGVWGVVVTAIAGDDAEEMLLSDEATPQNVTALADYLAEHAPLAAPLLRAEDLMPFFDREPFSGAVVICPRIAFDEWVLLMGDAAHSVIPSTGEGVNSGLEDAAILAEHTAASARSGSGATRGAPHAIGPFASYEAARLPDLHALGEYAWTLRDNLRSTDPARAVTNVVLRIGDAIAAKLPFAPSAQVEANLFGPDAGRRPYREAIGPWIKQRELIYPPLHRAIGTIGRVGKQVVRAGRRVVSEARRVAGR